MAPQNYKLPIALAGSLIALSGGSIGAAELLPLPTIEPEANPPLVKLGPFEVIPRVSTTALYDDNITLRGVDIRRDFIYSLTPGFKATTPPEDKGILPGLSLDYETQGNLFMKYDEYNSLDHAARLDALYPFAKLTLGASHFFSDSTFASAEAGEVIAVRANRTALTAEYDLSQKSSVELNLNQEIRENSGVSTLLNTITRSVEVWLNQKYSPKFTYSGGLVAGLQDVDQSADQTFQRALGRVRYLHSALFEFTAAFGAEFRQTKGGENSAYPTYRLGAVYRPFPKTALYLDLISEENNSIRLRDLNYRTTRVEFTARQLVFEKWSLTLKPYYERLKAVPLASTVTSGRDDHSFGTLLQADYQLTERWGAGVYYNFKYNSSTDPIFDYTQNKAAVYTSWKF